MADLSELNQQVEVLKFQLSVLGKGNPQGETILAQIQALQKQIAFEKIRQGLPS